tara:strand:+ start:17857 stop:18681 length:825 start_codon:yes stop_codon:yes gene_type:complete
MLSEIGLFYDGQGRGPGKVRDNLIKGLELLGVKVFHGEEREHTGWLHNCPPSFIPEHWLLGPNLFVLPTDAPPDFWSKKRRLVTPCWWTTDVYSQVLTQAGLPHELYTWAVGIDTDKFSPSDTTKTNDCIIYFKNGNLNDYVDVTKKLKSRNLSYEELRYGDYDEKDLIELAQRSKFVVTLTSTESQGIAYQELLSMNLPCYVFERDMWRDRPGFSCPASSAPYFDSRCGIKCKDVSFLDTFINDLEKYAPRDYILDNLTLEKCASEYLLMMEK